MKKNIQTGIQDFKKLKEKNAFYLDKTKQIYELTKNNYYFFGRPRRFGKSLTISTLKYLFLGEKELFNGLYIQDKWDWSEENTYPVIHITFSSLSKHLGENFEDKIVSNLRDFSKLEFGDEVIRFKDLEDNHNIDILKLGDIINFALKKFNKKQVVILIDEYDKAVLAALKNKVVAENVREFFGDFYAPVKDMDINIRFFFLSGLTKLMKMSLFSILNNLDDISFGTPFVDLIGYTQEELIANFKEDLEEIAVKIGVSYDEMVKTVKDNYNGFNFGNDSKMLYNPWDINNFIKNGELSYYWSDTGIPSAISDYVSDNAVNIEQIVDKIRTNDLIVTGTDLRVQDLNDLKIEVLFFNAGYLTIKEIISNGIYSLKFPNKETETVMIHYFLNLSKGKLNLGLFIKLSSKFVNGILSGNKDDIKEALEDYIKQFLIDIPGEWINNNPEGWMKTMIGVMLKINIIKWWGEIPGLKQRSDLLVPINNNSIAILEAKVDKPTSEAMDQIKDKYEPLAKAKGYENIMKIGVSWFRSEKVEDHKVEIIVED